MNTAKNKKLAQLLLNSGFAIGASYLAGNNTYAARIMAPNPNEIPSISINKKTDYSSQRDQIHRFYKQWSSKQNRLEIEIDQTKILLIKVKHYTGIGYPNIEAIISNPDNLDAVNTTLQDIHNSYKQPGFKEVYKGMVGDLYINPRRFLKTDNIIKNEKGGNKTPILELSPKSISTPNSNDSDSKALALPETKDKEQNAKDIKSALLKELLTKTKKVDREDFSGDNPDDAKHPPEPVQEIKLGNAKKNEAGKDKAGQMIEDGSLGVVQSDVDSSDIEYFSIEEYASDDEFYDIKDYDESKKEDVKNNMNIVLQELAAKKTKADAMKELLAKTNRYENPEPIECGGSPDGSAAPDPEFPSAKNPAGKDKAGRIIEDGSLGVVQRDIDLMLDERGDMSFAAMAAGDDNSQSKKAIWIRGIYASNSQDLARGNIMAGTVGFDFETDNNLLLGAAYSHAKGKYKYRDGDRTNLSNNIFSIYAQKEANNILLRGVISYSAGKVNAKDKIESTGDIVNSNFKTHAYAISASLGQKIHGCGFEIMPFISASYTHSINGAYKESGHSDPSNNLSYGKASSDEFTAKVGIRASRPARLESGALLVPHISISAQRDLKASPKSVSAWLDSGERVDLSAGGLKKAKFAYNAGAGLTYQKGNMELSAEYAGQFRHSYKTHQGSLKLKLFI